MPAFSILLFVSLSLMAAGLFLIVGGVREELRELSPAELSTSAPVVRSCRSRLHEHMIAQLRRLRYARRRLTPSRSSMLAFAELSASRKIFAGRVSQLRSPTPG